MRDIYDYTYVHVFNIHLCLLLQLDNNLSVEHLELQRENTHLKFIATYIILHCNAMYCSVTWLNGKGTIRVE